MSYPILEREYDVAAGTEISETVNSNSVFFAGSETGALLKVAFDTGETITLEPRQFIIVAPFTRITIRGTGTDEIRLVYGLQHTADRVSVEAASGLTVALAGAAVTALGDAFLAALVGEDNQSALEASMFDALVAALADDAAQTALRDAVAAALAERAPSAHVDSADIAVSDERVEILAANADRVEAAIYNAGEGAVRIGGATVTAARGLVLKPGAGMSLPGSGAVHAIRSGDDDAVLQVLEARR